jgi:hypothetical protein
LSSTRRLTAESCTSAYLDRPQVSAAFRGFCLDLLSRSTYRHFYLVHLAPSPPLTTTRVAFSLSLSLHLLLNPIKTPNLFSFIPLNSALFNCQTIDQFSLSSSSSPVQTYVMFRTCRESSSLRCLSFGTCSPPIHLMQPSSSQNSALLLHSSLCSTNFVTCHFSFATPPSSTDRAFSSNRKIKI